MEKKNPCHRNTGTQTPTMEMTAANRKDTHMHIWTDIPWNKNGYVEN